MIKKDPNQGLLADSDNFRSKLEARELCDLGCTVEEKYGPYTGWRLQLRNHFDEYAKIQAAKETAPESEEAQQRKPENVIEYAVEAGGRFSGLWSDVKDNRSKRIEIIRKTTDAPVAELTGE